MQQHIQLTNIMSDIDGQPKWRTNANKACAYYDGDQLTPEVVSKLDERGQPKTIHNLVAPAVDGVLGMEAKTRTDLLVQADDPDEEMELLAEVANAEFADAARLGRLDRARSEAYASQIKAGVGFVEVFRSQQLFGTKYKIKNVPRDEVYWDWFSTEADWSDCRWVMRCRWIDVDQLIAMVPSKADVIKHAASAWETFVDIASAEGTDASLVSAWEEYQGWSREQTEWLSINRKRIRLQIVYHRVHERVPALYLPDGRVVEFDQKNPKQVAAVASGRVKVAMAQVSKITESWFAGPHHLIDRPCSAPAGMYPIVPFFGYRKDGSGEPYGLIARAIPAQDEVNFRRIKLTWLLQVKRVIADKDATTMSRKQVMEEVERADGYVELNPDRKNHKSVSDAFQVQQDFNIASQQFNVMKESMQLIQDTMGIYGAFLGQDSGAKSGVAIANLVEQGATTLAEVNDNYRLGCQLIGELLLGYILEDMKEQDNRKITVNREDKLKRKTVMVNEVQDNGLRTNDLARLRAHIALAPIQQTTAYKSQLADRMMQIISQQPPQVQMATLDLVLELTDIPNKAEFMERVRGALGVAKDPEDMTPEEQQAQQQQQQQENEKLQLAMRELNAKVEKLEAEAKQVMAKAESEMSKVEGQKFDNAKTQVETARIIQEMDAAKEEMNTIQGNLIALIDGAIEGSNG